MDRTFALNPKKSISANDHYMDSFGRVVIDNKNQSQFGQTKVKQIEQYNIANSPGSASEKQS